MRVCLIVEGAYPYINGGVSSWLQQLMLSMPDVEFIIQVITPSKEGPKTFRYNIPDNVVAIQEIYLMDDDYVKGREKKIKLTKKQYQAFESLLFGEDAQWEVVFDFFRKDKISLNAFLMGKDFLEMTRKYYQSHFSNIIFLDFLWTMRSMYLSLFTILTTPTMEADLYHTVSTGYAGIYGSMEQFLHKKPLILTEHGIYTREREEEIIKADWVKGIYKELWIQQFKKISMCCYNYADVVTALFQDAKKLQIELGCKEEKIRVIANGVNSSVFEDVKGTHNENEIHFGAILRVTPIKDVKTMISAFHLAKEEEPNLKLYIMGPLVEDEDYAKECQMLVDELGVTGVIFTGQIQVKDYIGDMDILLLSSLSEGQPLVILEGFAAHKPFITTNVGNCKGLIEGEADTLGAAGIVVSIMNAREMADAMLKLVRNRELRLQMGEIGYQRVTRYYQATDSYHMYRALYEEVLQRHAMNQ